mmetsp:Transcript_2181/g.3216  ORF Transcript_2181/g.3216 Transcript_2181/m.3216 type:complete len:86 (+) Transcript_2181:1361-1618(+)
MCLLIIYWCQTPAYPWMLLVCLVLFRVLSYVVTRSKYSTRCCLMAPSEDKLTRISRTWLTVINGCRSTQLYLLALVWPLDDFFLG